MSISWNFTLLKIAAKGSGKPVVLLGGGDGSVVEGSLYPLGRRLRGIEYSGIISG